MRNLRTTLKQIVLFLGFLCAVILLTRLALQLGEIANPTTVGFSFLILVVLAAVFAGLAVAVVTSVAATLCFNYFFFPPIGTFRIAAPDDWVALFAFLFTAIVISRLTASAHLNARKAEALDSALRRLKEFGAWLLSVRQELVTLTGIAEGAVRILSLEYCSIHVYAEGRWHHFSGVSVGPLPQQVADSLKVAQDHPTGILELAEEQSLGVRYSRINTDLPTVAVLAVKSDYLTDDALNTLASMIAIRLTEVLRDTHLPSGAKEGR